MATTKQKRSPKLHKALTRLEKSLGKNLTKQFAKEARKAEKVTVRELIEMLTKCDWDDELKVVTEIDNEIENLNNRHSAETLNIKGVSQSAGFGVRIIVSNPIPDHKKS